MLVLAMKLKLVPYDVAIDWLILIDSVTSKEIEIIGLDPIAADTVIWNETLADAANKSEYSR